MNIGLCHLKEVQDNTLDSGLHYIRYIEEIPDATLVAHDEDEPDEIKEPLRIIICMTKISSRRLAQAQYLQSDIAFKRVAGFFEFEIGGLEPNAKLG